MPERPVTHATFCIERTYPASPERVFTALSDPAAKAKWFSGPPDWAREPHEMDFRVGGRERLVNLPPDKPAHVFDAVYQDIVPNERVIFSYDMHIGEARISVSLTTIELRPAGTGTKLLFTEQGAFLDGFDDPKVREIGTNALLDALGASLEAPGSPGTS